jgi:hypothetical protein
MASILEQADKELHLGQPRPWHEITADQYEWMLECLPPACWNGSSFVNSEPLCDDKDGKTYYNVGKQQDGKYYGRCSTIAEFKATRYQGVDNVLPAVTAGFYWIPSGYLAAVD